MSLGIFMETENIPHKEIILLLLISIVISPDFYNNK